MTISTPKPPAFFPDPDRHFFLVVDYLGRVGDQVTGNGGPLPLAEYTQTTPEDTRPTASLDTGSIIYASDTEKIQFSDGTDWVSLDTSEPTYETAAATSASGTANKKGSVTLGPIKFYFDRQTVVETGDDITPVDLALEFSEIWSVVCCQSDDNGNDRNVIALVKDSTTVDLINKGGTPLEITFHCIGLAAA